jgi:hypothetical protein
MGVIVIRLDDGDVVQDVAHVVGEKEEEVLPEPGGLSTFDGSVSDSIGDGTGSEDVSEIPGDVSGDEGEVPAED